MSLLSHTYRSDIVPWRNFNLTLNAFITYSFYLPIEELFLDLIYLTPEILNK